MRCTQLTQRCAMFLSHGRVPSCCRCRLRSSKRCSANSFKCPLPSFPFTSPEAGFRIHCLFWVVR